MCRGRGEWLNVSAINASSVDVLFACNTCTLDNIHRKPSGKALEKGDHSETVFFKRWLDSSRVFKVSD